MKDDILLKNLTFDELMDLYFAHDCHASPEDGCEACEIILDEQFSRDIRILN